MTTGNVGIGTKMPEERLDVEGKIFSETNVRADWFANSGGQSFSGPYHRWRGHRTPAPAHWRDLKARRESDYVWFSILPSGSITQKKGPGF